MMQAADGVRMFNFGSECPGPNPQPYQETCNLAKYGEPDPPKYDYCNIDVKAAIMIGGCHSRGCQG